MEYRFVSSGKTYRVNIVADKESWQVAIGDGKPLRVELITSSSGCYSFLMDGEPITAYAVEGGGKVYIFVAGQSFAFELEKGRARGTSGREVARGSGNLVASPMPGSLVKLLVSRGDEVEEGQTLAIVEAMKMENELRSPIKGVVRRVNFAEGNQVDALQPIIELEAL